MTALLPEPDVVYLNLAGGQKIWVPFPRSPLRGNSVSSLVGGFSYCEQVFWGRAGESIPTSGKSGSSRGIQESRSVAQIWPPPSADSSRVVAFQQ